MNHKKYSRGFTLIEVITSLGVAVVVGSIIGSVFLSSIKGTTKATALSVARESGTYAIAQIEKTLRNAQTLSSPPYPCTPLTPTPVQSITVTDSASVSTTFACGANTITSNGNSLIDNANLSISSCSFSCIQNSLVDYPTITFQFVVGQKNAVSFFEQKASIPFQTSVTLRSLNF